MAAPRRSFDKSPLRYAGVHASAVDALILAGIALGGVAAGAINSIAGGGTIISYPALLAAGVPPVWASATNTIALAPGALASAWAYRDELGENGRLALLLCIPAVVGTVTGAALLLLAPESVFEAVVPWMILGATMLIVVKDAIARRTSSHRTRSRPVWVAVAILGMSVYGGYFGAGIGIITLALLGLLHSMNIHEMNAMKSIIVGAINGLAAVYFLVRGTYDLGAALCMTGGTLAGGYFGAAIARRIDPTFVRWAVVAIGVGLALTLAVGRWA